MIKKHAYKRRSSIRHLSVNMIIISLSNMPMIFILRNIFIRFIIVSCFAITNVFCSLLHVLGFLLVENDDMIMKFIQRF